MGGIGRHEFVTRPGRTQKDFGYAWSHSLMYCIDPLVGIHCMQVDLIVGEHDPFRVGQIAETKPNPRLICHGRQTHRKLKIDRHIECDVEKFWPRDKGSQVRTDERNIEPPDDCSLELRPCFSPHFVQIRMVPKLLYRAGKPTVAVQKRGGMGEGAPPVEIEFRVHGQHDADVFSAVQRGCFASPRAGHHERRGCRNACIKCIADCKICRVGDPKPAAMNNDKPIGSIGAEAFNERAIRVHAAQPTELGCRHFR